MALIKSTKLIMHRTSKICVCVKKPLLEIFANAQKLHHINLCNKHSVAIVGSGPAGFYTAQQILKGNQDVIVDIFEILPVPFGLVRYGVAPDHPEVKNVINSFTQTALNERCKFIGNIDVGKDVSLREIRDAYSAVVLSYGASEDRALGINGENLKNVLSAKDFVGWYNGDPKDRDLQVNLDCDSAVIFGHGNVALDVARILLTPIEFLEKTDIAEHALECLRKSKVRQVHLVGRRGPLQVAFTIKELREMIKLPGTKPGISPEDVSDLDKVIKDLPRPRRRLTELLYKTAVAPKVVDKKLWASATSEWKLHFCRSPVRITGTRDGWVTGVDMAVNDLQGEGLVNKKAVSTDKRESLSCGLIIRSIGYKSLPLDSSVPFDESKSIIPNENYRVKGMHGVYCSGWVGTGPVGVINDTMMGSFDTGKVVLHDLQNITGSGLAKRNELVEKIQNKAVSFKDWQKIDRIEMKAGERIGKPREKLVTVKEMLQAVA